MAERLFRFDLAADDLAYLREALAFDLIASNSLATCGVDGVTLTRNQAELLRSHLTTTLAQIGFDENYELTEEGKRIERLIDTLYVQ